MDILQTPLRSSWRAIPAQRKEILHSFFKKLISILIRCKMVQKKIYSVKSLSAINWHLIWRAQICDVIASWKVAQENVHPRVPDGRYVAPGIYLPEFFCLGWGGLRRKNARFRGEYSYLGAPMGPPGSQMTNTWPLALGEVGREEKILHMTIFGEYLDPYPLKRWLRKTCSF